jgi:hypothetical protein
MNCFKKPLLLSFLLLGLSGCGLPAGPAVPPSFVTLSSNKTQLSVSSANAINPQIAVDSSSRVFVTWQDTTSNKILFSSFIDGPSLPPPPVPVAIPGSAGGSFPRMTTDGNGNAFVIWYSNNNIFLNYGTSSGFQTTPVLISTTPVPPSQAGVAPPADITYDSGSSTLYVSWSQCSTCPPSPTINDIFYATTLIPNPLVNPLTVSAPVMVTNNNSSNIFLLYPKIKLFGGTPYIVYQSTGPTSPQSGLYLSQMSTPINVAGSQATASNASLGIDNSGNSYVAWNPTQTSDVYFNTLPAGNSQFNSPPLNLSHKPSTYGPAIALDSSQYVYVAYFARPAYQTTYDVFLTRTTNGGSIFTDAFDISNTTMGDSFSYAPGIAITGKTGYIVWDDNTYTPGHSTYQILLQKIILN